MNYHRIIAEKDPRSRSQNFWNEVYDIERPLTHDEIRQSANENLFSTEFVPANVGTDLTNIPHPLDSEYEIEGQMSEEHVEPLGVDPAQAEYLSSLDLKVLPRNYVSKPSRVRDAKIDLNPLREIQEDYSGYEPGQILMDEYPPELEEGRHQFARPLSTNLKDISRDSLDRIG